MDSLETLKTKLTQLKPKLQEDYHVTQLGIFGSYVRGEQTDSSDVDILVEFDSAFQFGLVTFCALESQLSDSLDKKVDLVMKDALKPYIGQKILQEVVYI